MVLLIGAGLLVRSYQRIQNSNPGFDARNVLSFRLSLPSSKYKGAAVTNFYKQLAERIKTLPGVEATGTSYSLPMSSVALAWGPITIEGYVPKNSADFIMSNERLCESGIFQGRWACRWSAVVTSMSETSRARLKHVIVNETLAQRFWPNQDPLGKRLERGGQRTMADCGGRGARHQRVQC